MTTERCDVIAIRLTDGTVLWVEPNKTPANAEAFIMMAVMRQGVEDRYFTTVPSGTYHAGDTYRHEPA